MRDGTEMETRRYQRLETFRPADRGRSRWVALLWQMVQALLLAPSPHFCHGWRRFWLRLFGAKIGKDVVIRPSASVHFPWRLTLGDRVWIGDEVRLYSLGEISIGSDSVISQQAYLCAGTHDPSDPSFPTLLPPIHIGSEVWIGARAFIGPGASVGDGAVVGALSGVFKHLPGGRIYRGNPARDAGARPTGAFRE
ncbi:WcaF family extracellular polysaccharide biosynthesis acetyltransferase [Lacibacterium aquatile]|uniref:WcaF family extracellular polysaccharide biosynthesis acetyltransferase n=1 Tax=Lacibacterium aquatile TaxID=1168082 RepID=A0ABW5DXG4_9PROT